MFTRGDGEGNAFQMGGGCVCVCVASVLTEAVGRETALLQGQILRQIARSGERVRKREKVES